MKSLKFIILFVIGILCFSCQSEVNLKSDKYISEIFTTEEIKEIERMVNYVDDCVIEKTGETEINAAYHQYLDSMKLALKGNGELIVLCDDVLKFQFIESLDSIVFSEFWRFKSPNTIRYQDSIYKDFDGYRVLNLQCFGRYVKYLEKVAPNDEFFHNFVEVLPYAGGIPASLMIGFPEMHEKFDFTIPKNRLFVVVFLLRIGESTDKKMERLLKQKGIPQKN